MSLQPFRPVDRRTSWRQRLPFWDRETFQTISVGRLGNEGNATVAFALFPEHEDCVWSCGWRDYGWVRPWRRKPILSVSTDDGSRVIALEEPLPSQPDAPASAAILVVHPYYLTGIPRGQYRTSLVAAYADGTVLDLGSDLVTFTGEPLATAYNAPLFAGGSQPAGGTFLANSATVAIPPILPGLPIVSNAPPASAGGYGLTPELLTPDIIAAILPLLPTTLPALPGQPWNNGGLLSWS